MLVVSGVNLFFVTFFSMMCSKRCGGKFLFDDISSMMSRAVSVPVQKSGGLSHHPICRLLGTTISMSSSFSIGLMDGST